MEATPKLPQPARQEPAPPPAPEPDPAPQDETRVREPVEYFVYEAQADDIAKEGVANQLTLVGSALANDEKEARWLVVDGDKQDLGQRVRDGNVAHLLALPASRCKPKPTHEEPVQKVKRH